MPVDDREKPLLGGEGLKNPGRAMKRDWGPQQGVHTPKSSDAPEKQEQDHHSGKGKKSRGRNLRPWST